MNACGSVESYYTIAGGDYAQIESHPWIAYLKIDRNLLCGASLIPHKQGSSAYLVTAAHCVKDR